MKKIVAILAVLAISIGLLCLTGCPDIDEVMPHYAEANQKATM